MVELRPNFMSGDPPLSLAIIPTSLLDGSVRPVCRGLILAVAIALPALGPFAVKIPGSEDQARQRAAVAPVFAPAGGAAARLALLQKTGP
ncbi:hypothetical protein Mchl_4779 [Methylorubrum extorquens CM4]|uniref:Uncharacterized protein n=1 Tax=Methylorubrum extorquens (strain CM4 / NCIMB 13688) TaxID=440085 RepID=B7KRM6_METC4|nr:hypothetical protein Mchl_4779 [Methylorubrum extorquens CM4]